MKFSALDRNKKPDFDKLKNQFSKKLNKTTKEEDTRFWKPTVNEKNGVGRAIIKFLPSPNETGLYFIERKQHFYSTIVNGKQQWFVHWCNNDVGKPCFQCKKNSELWQIGTEAAKNIARRQGRNYHYYANILVIKDYQNPENDGKVFLYDFSATIQKKLQEAVNGVPANDDLGIDAVDPIDPFGFFNTAKFDIRIKKPIAKDSKAQISTDYTESKFFDHGDFSDDEEYLTGIMEQTVDLEAEFLNEKVYADSSDDAMAKDYYRCHPAEKEGFSEPAVRHGISDKPKRKVVEKPDVDLDDISDEDLKSLQFEDDEEDFAKTMKYEDEDIPL